MSTYREPEDVDFVVESGPASPEMAHATDEYIKAMKRRDAARAAVRIPAPQPGDFGSPNEADAEALLESWERVIEDLDRAERRDVGGRSTPDDSTTPA